MSDREIVYALKDEVIDVSDKRRRDIGDAKVHVSPISEKRE